MLLRNVRTGAYSDTNARGIALERQAPRCERQTYGARSHERKIVLGREDHFGRG